jgi:Zn-dependent protease
MLPQFILEILVLFMSLTVHEFAHGFTAYKLGDYTAKLDGRLSLNPLRHIDPIGAIMMIVCHFGWAKPVMVNPRNLKNPKQDMAVISFAGPLANFIFAAVCTILFAVTELFLPHNVLYYLFDSLFSYGIVINISLAIFNLLPIPPLDGSKVVASLMPNEMYRSYLSVNSNITMVIFIVLLWTGLLGRILNPMTEVVVNAYTTAVSHLFGLFL